MFGFSIRSYTAQPHGEEPRKRRLEPCATKVKLLFQ
jgi:hypothetical protein